MADPQEYRAIAQTARRARARLPAVRGTYGLARPDAAGTAIEPGLGGAARYLRLPQLSEIQRAFWDMCCSPREGVVAVISIAIDVGVMS